MAPAASFRQAKTESFDLSNYKDKYRYDPKNLRVPDPDGAAFKKAPDPDPHGQMRIRVQEVKKNLENVQVH